MVADAGNFPPPQPQQAQPPPQQQYAPPPQQPAAPPQQQYAPPQQQYAPPQQQYAPPPQQPAAPPQQPSAQPAPGNAPAAVVTNEAGLLRVDAELGAHSATNFYKGLSGNDIVDSGGIFIATYQLPKIGAPVLIHISMPGGYEFQAKGVVKWTRETPQSSFGGTHAPPGFGAQFTEISPESRQLVYRYVRNREPLFHDDL
jgi:hypothetical protein